MCIIMATYPYFLSYLKSYMMIKYWNDTDDIDTLYMEEKVVRRCRP